MNIMNEMFDYTIVFTGHVLYIFPNKLKLHFFFV